MCYNNNRGGNLSELVLVITIIFIIFLIIEKRNAFIYRKKLKYVIHVNGIRGKSTTTRLIHAGLKAGGYNVICKTTGTLPMIVDNENVESLIQRKGKANIKEQIWALREAVIKGAEVLVVECMAVNPNLQYISENNILHSNIGVITNVRLDHTEEMGNTLEEICESLCNMIPINGTLVTSEVKYFNKIEEFAKLKKTKIVKSIAKPEYDNIHFADNVACAISVCQQLGVDENTALNGMANFVKDPYDLSIHKLKTGGFFVSGLSINDPMSSEIALSRVINKINIRPKKITLLINNRPDRGYRAKHMILLTNSIKPERVWLMGSFVNNLRKSLVMYNPTIFQNAKSLPFDEVEKNELVFAVGNIGNHGNDIIDLVSREYAEHV